MKKAATKERAPNDSAAGHPTSRQSQSTRSCEQGRPSWACRLRIERNLHGLRNVAFVQGARDMVVPEDYHSETYGGG